MTGHPTPHPPALRPCPACGELTGHGGHLGALIACQQTRTAQAMAARYAADHPSGIPAAPFAAADLLATLRSRIGLPAAIKAYEVVLDLGWRPHPEKEA